MKTRLIFHKLDILRAVVCLALSVMIVTLLAQIILGRKDTPNVSPTRRYTIALPANDYSAAAGRIFGEAAPTSMTVTSTDTSVELQGVLLADDSSESLATLLLDGRETVFSVGDTLPDGEKLQRVGATSVTLSHGGSEREIELQITGDPIATFDVAYLAQGGQIVESPTAKINLPAISISSGKNASVASRLAELRSQALQALVQKARSMPPPSSTAHKPDHHL